MMVYNVNEESQIAFLSLSILCIFFSSAKRIRRIHYKILINIHTLLDCIQKVQHFFAHITPTPRRTHAHIS